MKLSENFTLAEFVASSKARQLGIFNELPAGLLEEARRTAQMLERIRAALSDLRGVDVPILISSGYRCHALNAAVGGSNRSDHIRALAADWSAPAFGTPYQIAVALAPMVRGLGIGQLIYERPVPGRVWVHTSTRLPAQPVNRVITIGPTGVMLGIQER